MRTASRIFFQVTARFCLMIAMLAVSAGGCAVLSIRKPSPPPWPAVPVKTIQVVPMGWLDQEPIPAGEGVRIAAGAMESPAHQARVLIETEAGEAGVRVPIQVVGGQGRSPGGDARLTMDGVTAFGGGSSVLVTTGEKGRISGMLTSSECMGTCFIVAGNMDTQLRCSSFDLCGGETDWSDLPPGVYTNTLVLRKIPAFTTVPTNLEERLRQIVVPYVDCRQLAVPKAIAYLEAACERYETPGPGRKGRIRIILEGEIQTPENDNTVTFLAHHISAWDCAKIIAEISGRKCSARDHRTLVIVPCGNEPSGAQGADENDAMELDPFRVDEI